MYFLNNWFKLWMFFCLNMVLILCFQFFMSWYDYYYYIINMIVNNVGVLNIMYLLSLDNISVMFLLLSAFLLMICLVLNWYVMYKELLLNMLMMLTFVMLMNMFLVNDLFMFFFFFESMVIPMFLLMGIWGSSTSSMSASYLLLLYTLIGSMFSMFAFLVLYQCMGSTNFMFLTGMNMKNMNVNLLFMFCFLGFAVKMPMVPLHLWLPEAHVEAPTMGSILLAGMLLKLSFYAFMRLLFLCMNGWYLMLVYTILFMGFLVPCFSAFVQLDMKKVMAFSSVSHMNFGMFGLFSKNFMGFMGCFYLMMGHAIVASMLFFFMGILYDRYKTSMLLYYGGLFLVMPLWSFFFFLAMLANFGLPGTMNFVGEFMVLLSMFKINFMITFFLFLGLLLTLGYSLFLYNRIAHGFLKNEFISYFSDITRKEFFMLISLIMMIYLWGMKPQMLMNFLFTVSYYLFCLI